MLKELKVFLPMTDKIKTRDLNYISIKNGLMRYTDLENTISIPVDDDRTYLLPLDVMKLILKQHPKEMKISVINSDKSIEVKFDINTAVFPFIEEDNEHSMIITDEVFTNIGTWSQEVLLELYKQVKFVSTDELKPAINGIFIDQNGSFSSCATDAHILRYLHGIENYQSLEDFKGIISAKLIKILFQFGKHDLVVQKSKNFLKFELSNGVVVYSKLINESYPNFLHVLEAELVNNITFEREKMLNAITNSKSFAGPTKLGAFNIMNGVVEITVNNSTRNIEFEFCVPTESRDQDHDLKKIKIGLNLVYFEKILKDIESKKVNWYYESVLDPSLFKTTSENRTHLLMPVKLKDY